MTETCTNCAKPLSSDARFCRECGAAVAAEPTESAVAPLAPGQCTACGNANAPDARFCRNCGEELSESAAAIEQFDDWPHEEETAKRKILPYLLMGFVALLLAGAGGWYAWSQMQESVAASEAEADPIAASASPASAEPIAATQAIVFGPVTELGVFAGENNFDNPIGLFATLLGDAASPQSMHAASLEFCKSKQPEVCVLLLFAKDSEIPLDSWRTAVASGDGHALESNLRSSFDQGLLMGTFELEANNSQGVLNLDCRHYVLPADNPSFECAPGTRQPSPEAIAAGSAVAESVTVEEAEARAGVEAAANAAADAEAAVDAAVRATESVRGRPR